MQWYIQRKLYADDYFVIFGMVSLTALSAAITMLLPQFYLSGEYVQAAASNPLTPLPLPEDEFLARTITSLKFMFRYVTHEYNTFEISLIGRKQSDAFVLDHTMGWCVQSSQIWKSFANHWNQPNSPYCFLLNAS